MKKLVISLLIAVGAFVLVLGNYDSKANDSGIIDLYPYDNENNMTADLPIVTGVRTGKGNWSLEYDGYRYHTVSNGVFYAKNFEDKSVDGLIQADELNHQIGWSSLGAVIINDTDKDFTIDSKNANRNDMLATGVNIWVWVTFDENGRAIMYENSYDSFWIIDNNGTWELASQDNIAAWTADSSLVPANAQRRPIRIVAKDNGYELEPLNGNQSFFQVGGGVDGKAESSIIDGNPAHLKVAKGHTVYGVGTLERNGTNKKHNDFVAKIPHSIVANTATMKKEYTQAAPSFGDTITKLDTDTAQDGINVVVEVNSEFKINDLVKDVKTTYENMFDDAGKIIAEITPNNYEIEVLKDDNVIETLKVTYDATTEKYTAEESTKVLTSVFGGRYELLFRSKSPINTSLVVEEKVELVVGVFSPKFVGVPKNAISVLEGQPINIFNPTNNVEIKADNGYGLDLLHTAQVNYNGLNVYNPTPGTYTIDLRLDYHYFKEGIKPTVTFGGVTHNLSSVDVNQADANVVDVHMYTPKGYADIVAKWDAMSWTSELLIIEDGKIISSFSRANNHVMDKDNQSPTKDAKNLKTVDWFKSVVLEENQMAVVIKGTSGIPVNPAAKAAKYGDAFTYSTVEVADVEHDFVIERSFKVNVVDTTKPQVILKEQNLVVNGGSDAKVNDIILNNVIATDNYDQNPGAFVVSNGGLDLSKPGVYDVKVQATDAEGNVSEEVSFKVTVTEVADSLDVLTAKVNKLQSQNTVVMVLAIVLPIVFAGGAFAAAYFIFGKKNKIQE